MHIALVEDSKSHATLWERTVADQHPESRISSFETAHDFLNTLGDGRFDLAVIDQSLPDMDGPEVIARVRAQQPELPIIIIGGDDAEAAAEVIKSSVRNHVVTDQYHSAVAAPVFDPISPKQSVTFKRKHGEDIGRETEKLEMAAIMAATLQHEINNPLMAILGNVELLENDLADLGGGAAEKLRMIETSVKRIQEIVRKMAILKASTIIQTPAGPMLQVEKSRVRARRRRSQTALSNKSI